MLDFADSAQAMPGLLKRKRSQTGMFYIIPLCMQRRGILTCERFPYNLKL